MILGFVLGFITAGVVGVVFLWAWVLKDWEWNGWR